MLPGIRQRSPPKKEGGQRPAMLRNGGARSERRQQKKKRLDTPEHCTSPHPHRKMTRFSHSKAFEQSISHKIKSLLPIQQPRQKTLKRVSVQLTSAHVERRQTQKVLSTSESTTTTATGKQFW